MVQSLSSVPAYKQFYNMYLRSDYNMSFLAWCDLKGYTEILYQEIENYLETGDPYHGKDDVDTLNSGRHIRANDSALFQSEDAETYYEFDWKTGNIKSMNKQEVATLLGLEEGTDYDTLMFGYNSASFTDYRFNHLDDGQDATKKTLVSSKYGSKISFVSQEFDIDYIIDALYIDPSDPQYAIASQILDDLFDNASQWLTESEIEELYELRLTYGDNSAEYNDRLKELILENLDALNEWTDDHNHVRGTGSDFGGAPDDDGNGEVPDIDMTSWLTAAGFLTQYSRGDKREIESTNNSQSNRRKELQAQMDADLATLANALQNQLGAEYTDYINKAVAATVAHEELIKTGKKHHRCHMHIKTYGEYSIKEVIDVFKAEFEKICAANGRTEEQIAADNKKREDQKSAYKTLNSMKMSSVAKDAGVNSSYKVVNAETADDFREKAYDKILEPMRAQILSRMAGKGIPEADLNEILEYAMSEALVDPTQWTTKDGSYNYEINSSKVINLFEEAVKSAIKAKGYNF